MADAKQKNKDELRASLRSKIEEKRMARGAKQHKEAVLDQTLKNIGIDKEKFKADVEAGRKQGGLEITMKK